MTEQDISSQWELFFYLDVGLLSRIFFRLKEIVENTADDAGMMRRDILAQNHFSQLKINEWNIICILLN